jgi:hypothetical protein
MSSGVTFHAFGNARECEGMNPTLSSELPFWELKSQWTLKSSKGNCRGQNSLDLKVPYIIRKFLECRCLKWAHMTHLGISLIPFLSGGVPPFVGKLLTRATTLL